MATILKDAPYMGFPLSIKRGNPAPVDTTAVWYNKTELENYAASGATAYVGQILTLYADVAIGDGETKKVCEAYMISSESGTLVKLAQTTASGDLASDVANLQSQVAVLIAAVGKKAVDDEPATGIYKEIADVITLANSKVASVKAADKSITVAGTATAPTVKVALSAVEGNALELAADGLKVTIPTVDVPEYTIKQKTLSAEEAKTSPYAAIYQLMKGDTQAGVDINIPKDMVVQSGTVETFYDGALPEGVDKPGTYIVLILANAGSKPLYIPVSSLVDVYTGTPTEDAKTATVLVNVDPTTHVITASIKNSSVTEAMLNSTIQASLKKADTAVQAIATGSDNGTISVDGEDVAVKGLADAAYATVASLNTTAKGYADNAKTAIIGNADTDTADSQTLEGIKKYAHGQAVAAQEGATKAAENLVNDLDVTDTAEDGKVVSAISQSKGKISVTRRALVAADIPELAQSKISGLETVLEGKQDNITFDGKYDPSTNKAATVATVNTAVDGLRHTKGSDGEDIDTVDSQTIKGAKLYAKSLVDIANESIASLNEKVNVSGNVQDAIDTAVDTAKSEILGGSTKTIKALENSVDAINNNLTETTTLAQTTKTALDSYKTSNDAAVAEAKKAGTDATAAVTALENGKVKTNADNIAKNAGDIGTLQDDVEELKETTKGISGAMHFAGVSTSNPKGDKGATVEGHTWAKGDVVLWGNKEYVLAGDTNIADNWHELGDETIYAIKGDLNVEKIGGGVGEYISSIKQTDGKIVAEKAALPEALKNPNALTFGSKSYDGSAAAEVTAADLGALTQITTTANGGLKVTGTNQIDIDTTVTFILNGGTSAD